MKSSGLVRRTIGNVQAVDGVSFEVPEGSALGLVGESGCGKSTTGRLITRLYDPTAGSMMFEGHDLATLSNRAMTPMRKEVQMIFQDPYSSLNPRHTVGTIVGTPLRVHNVVPEKQVLNRVRELLEVVGLNPEHYNRYPNEFSGGQRQRIGIARALALQPKLLVADEPVSALDVSIQAQVVNLLRDVQREFNIAFLFIAHDLAVVRHYLRADAADLPADSRAAGRWRRAALPVPEDQSAGEEGDPVAPGEGAFGICSFWGAEYLALGGGSVDEAENPSSGSAATPTTSGSSPRRSIRRPARLWATFHRHSPTWD